VKRLVPLLVLCCAALFPVGARADVAFQATALAPAGSYLQDVAVGDLDGRNGPDIVSSYYEGGIAVQLNDGNGHFGAPTNYATGCFTSQVELADVGSASSLQSDGHLDAVISCVYGSGDAVYLGRLFGDGNGGFSEPYIVPELNFGAFGGGVAGTHEAFTMVEARGSSGPPIPAWGYLYSYFTGNFEHVYERGLCFSYDWQTRDCLPYMGQSPEPGIVFVPGHVADALLFTTGGSEGLLDWGQIPPPWHASGREFGADPTPEVSGGNLWRSIAIGDLQGNGPDLFTAAGSCGCVPGQPASGQVNVLYGDAGGVPYQHPASFPSGDFDLDGKTDVVGTSWHYSPSTGGVGTVFVQSGNGAGGLGAPQELPLYNGETFNVNKVRVADLDHNGSADVVAIVGGEVRVLLNQKLRPPPPLGTPATNALTGIKGLPKKATALANGTVLLGTATNPPTASVGITLTLPAAGAKAKDSALAAAAKPKKKGKKKKETVIGKAQITVPAGKTVPLKVKLSAKARALLKKGPLHAKLALLVVSVGGAKEAKTQPLTVKPPTAKKKGKKAKK
jgi:hypothetical protein